MTHRITPLTAVVIAMVALACGCSDDLVCPELVDTLPYISALVVQRAGGGDESTHVELVCTADPLPSGTVLWQPTHARELNRRSPMAIGLKPTPPSSLTRAANSSGGMS